MEALVYVTRARTGYPYWTLYVVLAEHQNRKTYINYQIQELAVKPWLQRHKGINKSVHCGKLGIQAGQENENWEETIENAVVFLKFLQLSK